MHKAIRSQADDLFDIASLEAGTTNDPRKGRARQEHKDEADINVMLRRFGTISHNKPWTFTETDYELDLQQAMDAVTQAKQAYRSLPDKLRKDYPTWTGFLAAVNKGEVNLKDGPEPVAEPAKTS